MERYEIHVATERCTGCLRCQLSCSDLYTNTFNLSQARIRVDVLGAECTICFTEECNECGVCVDQCLYDALTKTEANK